MSVIIFLMFTSSSEVTVTQGDSTLLHVVQLSSRGEEEKKNEKNRQIKEQLAVSKTCNNDRTNYFPSLYSSN